MLVEEEIDGTATITIGDQKIPLRYAEDNEVCAAYLPEAIFDAMEKAGKFTLNLFYGYRMQCLFVQSSIYFLIIEHMAIQAFMATPGHTSPVIYMNRGVRYGYFFPN